MNAEAIEIPYQGGKLPIAFRRGGSGVPLVLLHGGSGSWSHWQRNLAALGRRFTLIVPDMPGFGDSGDVAPGTEGKVYISLVAEFLARAMPRSGPFHLGGFSFGGMIAAGVATRFPERVARISLLAPGGWGLPQGRRIELKKRSRAMEEAALAAVYRHNLGDLMLHREDSITAESQALYRSDIERARFRNLHLSWSERLLDDVAAIEAPLQFIWGAHDRTATPSVAHRTARLHAVRPGVPVYIVPDAGHWVQYEEPEAVNRLLTAFHDGADPHSNPRS